MNILFVSAEVAPYAKVGGLGDVAASLPKALAAMGHEVRVITPDHGGRQKRERRGKRVALTVPAFGRNEPLTVIQRSGPAPVYLLANVHFFGRDAVYGQPDDLYRYHFFCLAVQTLLQQWDWVPDIVHCNDWHTGLLPFGLRNLAWSNPAFGRTASVFTIHNLAYRGPDDLTDIMTQAIYYADAVSTVSPTYAREIATWEHGHGLDPLLRLRADHLYGILNGLDLDVFDPGHDQALAATFGPANVRRKAQNKAALQRKFGLSTDAGRPVVGVVSRIDYQKGTDLLAEVLERGVTELNLQFAVIGSGDGDLEQQLKTAAAPFKRSVGLLKGYHPDAASLVYGGSDLFLMPSRSEPCGLGQLIAMRYGSVPVVRRTGGLADTVTDVAADPVAGTGFVFDEYDVDACFGALTRATAAFEDAPAWDALRRRIMQVDHSWNRSAQEYVAMYQRVLDEKR